MSQHLTDAIVRRLPVPAKGNKIYKDDKVKGLGARVTANGVIAYTLDYTTQAGRQRRHTIGSAEHWKATDARAEAKRLRQLIDQGGDPLADIEDERAALTMGDLFDRFEAEHLPRLRPRTAQDYRELLANHIRPHFGKHTKVADVRHDDVQRLHDRVTKAGKRGRPTPYNANRVLAVLSKAFGLSIRWEMRDTNPCKGIEKNQEHRRERYVRPQDELPALVETLNQHPNQQTANAFRLLLLTGARRGEVLSMRWADLDLTAGVWTKSASATKQKKRHTAPISAPARQLLSEIHEAQLAQHQVLGEFVFPGAGGKGHVNNVKRAWANICKAAGITGLRMHDLRHSFASQLASGGASLPLIGALLGHSNPNTTHRYAHLFDDPQRAAVEKVGAAIVNAGKPVEEPVKLSRRGG
jgi:integrase